VLKRPPRDDFGNAMGTMANRGILAVSDVGWPASQEYRTSEKNRIRTAVRGRITLCEMEVGVGRFTDRKDGRRVVPLRQTACELRSE